MGNLVMACGPSSLVGPEAAITAAEMEQWIAARARLAYADDLPNNNAVVAAVVHGGGSAFPRGERIAPNRMASQRPCMIAFRVQLPFEGAASGGETSSALLSFLVQDAD